MDLPTLCENMASVRLASSGRQQGVDFKNLGTEGV